MCVNVSISVWARVGLYCMGLVDPYRLLIGSNGSLLVLIGSTDVSLWVLIRDNGLSYPDEYGLTMFDHMGILLAREENIY